MIPDYETNTIYFSELIWPERNTKRKQNALEVFSLLDKHNVKHEFLKNTKDIWARDYMPIQIDEKRYLEYVYAPDYLNNEKDMPYQTNPAEAFQELGIEVKKTDLIIDGGNVVKSKNCIIMTDKVLIENNFKYSKDKIVGKLKEDFEVEKIILIPWDKKERFGHADGVLRFIDENSILVNHHYKKWPEFEEKFRNSGLNVNYLEFTVKKQDRRNWAYINFLQTKDLILLPQFGVDEDEQAFNEISRFYPKYEGKVEKVNATQFVRGGGALNCISWTIKKHTEF